MKKQSQSEHNILTSNNNRGFNTIKADTSKADSDTSKADSDTSKADISNIMVSHFKTQAIGLLVILASIVLMSQNANAWLEKLVPSDEVYTIQATDRDVAFLIDDYIYDARDFCYMQAGDKVVFFQGRYGLDYRASIYNLTGKERCEVLLRERYQPRNQNTQVGK